MLTKKDVIVLSIYSKDTIYEKEILHLENSCKEFDINFVKIGYKDTKSWFNNVNKKPELIQDFLNEVDKTVWFLDADIVIVQDPEFEIISDIKPSFRIRKYGVNSGSMFLPKVKFTNQIVNEWSDTLKNNLNHCNPPRLVEQNSLNEVLNKNNDCFELLDSRFNYKVDIKRIIQLTYVPKPYAFVWHRTISSEDL